MLVKLPFLSALQTHRLYRVLSLSSYQHAGSERSQAVQHLLGTPPAQRRRHALQPRRQPQQPLPQRPAALLPPLQLQVHLAQQRRAAAVKSSVEVDGAHEGGGHAGGVWAAGDPQQPGRQASECQKLCRLLRR